MALIFWEIYNRLEVNGVANPHQLPFEDIVKEDTPQEMIKALRNLVCSEERRPDWNPALQDNPTIAKIQNFIGECWAQNPRSRTSTYYVKSRLQSLGLIYPNGP